MGLFGNNIRLGSSVADDYEIEKSLRFNPPDDTYLSRTFGTNSSNTTKTFSFWVKRSSRLSDYTTICATTQSGNIESRLQFANNGAIKFTDRDGGDGTTDINFYTTPLYRDCSAWYHIVLIIDTTNGTAGDRTRIYVNGSRVTSLTSVTNPSSSYAVSFMRSSAVNFIGVGAASGSDDFSGYLAEMHFLDGTVKGPDQFGKTNPVTGQWIAKEYRGGGYGNNGFYLNFSDNSGTTATTLGKDSSGNGNNWTPNNFSVAAGAGNDSVVDTPTNNYPTLNSLHWCVLKGTSGTGNGPDYTQGNLRFVGPSSANNPWQRSTAGTMVVNSGAWYFEVTIENFSNGNNIGVAEANSQDSNGEWQGVGRWTWNCFDEQRMINGTNTTNYGTKPSNGDIVGCAVDIDNNTINWFVNNTSQGETTNIGISGKSILIGAITATFAAERYTINFGQQGFAYTPPTGFKALCTANLPEPTIKKGEDHFDTLLYTGNNNSGRQITGLEFKPDFVWFKKRSGGGQNHTLYDSVRGTGKRLMLPSTDGEATVSDELTSFNDGGFTIDTDNFQNENGKDYVAWCWKAGGSASSNSDGTITTNVSVNATAGFSIISYTGGGSAGTIGHGLGVAPQAIITKRLSGVEDWKVYHKDIQGGYFLKLNVNQVETSNTDVYPNTAPTSTVYSIGSHDSISGNNDTYIAYCFSGVTGYSNFGTYKGNALVDGTFVYTGFKPAVLLTKCKSGTEDWQIWDSTRDPYNLMVHRLFPSNSDQESTNTDVNTSQLDFLSNGFKWKGKSDDTNGSGDTYVYMAFAEIPFKYSNAR